MYKAPFCTKFFYRRKRALLTRYPTPPNAPVNAIPRNCYWCCKPAPTTQKPDMWWAQSQRPQNVWQRPTVTPSTTSTTTAYWWYPNTTKRPNTWKPAPTYKPEVIEAKVGDNELKSHFPASDALLRFKFWKSSITPIREDFVVIEDNYSPEIIETRRRQNYLANKV